MPTKKVGQLTVEYIIVPAQIKPNEAITLSLKLPLAPAGTASRITLQWGDGTTQLVLLSLTAIEVKKVYAREGRYTIKAADSAPDTVPATLGDITVGSAAQAIVGPFDFDQAADELRQAALNIAGPRIQVDAETGIRTLMVTQACRAKATYQLVQTQQGPTFFLQPAATKDQATTTLEIEAQFNVITGELSVTKELARINDTIPET